jgi:hypothetical protein
VFLHLKNCVHFFRLNLMKVKFYFLTRKKRCVLKDILMNLSDLNHLKTLSWYTTIPLLVCAWMLQDASKLDGETWTVLSMLVTVGEYFIKVLGGLLVMYIFWLYASVYLETTQFPLTHLLANYLLTFACVGLGIHMLKPENISLPINFLWFASCASISFNLYQLQHSVYNED